MWNSETYGQLGLSEIPDKLMLFYDRNAVYGEPMELAIGTDSQNHCAGTKIVTVISMICKGHGGIFFYETEIRELIKVVKQKLETETYISLETAKDLLDELDFPEELVANRTAASFHEALAAAGLTIR